MTDKGKPLYMIGVVADMLKLHPQTLRMYERKGLIRPSRTVGKTRMYSRGREASRGCAPDPRLGESGRSRVILG